MKIETEEKYYCMEPERLINIAEKLGFKKKKEIVESDEYFTDINSNFIKNRTCLRIRKNDNNMEITYKGKSDTLLGQYCKLENNISSDVDKYDNFISLFSSLGYYSYVLVMKKRIVYELVKDHYKYSIMIDTLPEIGGFVEFELLSDQSSTTKKEAKIELSNFVLSFKDLNLQEATEPYRDIVAKHIYKKITQGKTVLNICLDLDGELLKYLKDFYKKYKNEISEYFGHNISFNEYKNNIDVNSKVSHLINDYLENLIFTSNDLLITMELLKQISYNKIFLTKVNETFVKCFFEKLNIEYENVIYISSKDNINNTLKKNNIDIENTIFINDKDFKVNNSTLLVIINQVI